MQTQAAEVLALGCSILASESASGRSQRGQTPESASAQRFLAKHVGADTPLDDTLLTAAFPTASHVKRSSCASHETVLAHLQTTGSPLVVSDALRTWDRSSLSAAALAARLPGTAVVCNDRAPARRKDGLLGRPQITLSATLSAYVSYLSSAVAHNAPPLYLNGWRPLESCPELKAEMPQPYFMEMVDQTNAILTQLDHQLFKTASGGGAAAAPAAAAAGGGTWWRGISAALWKLFIGPAGTVTRLHVDAQDAHGWLAQIEGYKLFILYPPSSTESLRPIQEEGKESMQSELDPLDDAAAVSGCQVALLQPGEAILVPRGWWHYAVALTPSTTAQANFYEAGTNAAALVSFVLARVAPLLKAKRR